MTNTIKFDLRPVARGPVFVGSYAPGDRIETWEPEIGNTVSMHVGKVIVLAKITSVAMRSYGGEVIAFENHDEYELQGLKPGDRIDFSFEQLFSCST